MATNKTPNRKTNSTKLRATKSKAAISPEEKLEAEYNNIADQLVQLSETYTKAVKHAENSTDLLLKLEKAYLIDKTKLEKLLAQADKNRIELIKNSSNIEWSKADLASSISQREAKKAIMIEEELIKADARKKQLREQVKTQSFNITKISMSQLKNSSEAKRQRLEVDRLAGENVDSIRSSLSNDRLARIEKRRTEAKQLKQELTREIEILKANTSKGSK